MHFEQKYYVSIIKKHFPEHFAEVSVLEVGSYDVNGSIREIFKNCEYTGLDLMPGPGVDMVVSSGHEYETYKRFETVLSCECFEHNPYYFETFENMVSLACGGGLVIFTCATEGRPEHGTSRTSPDQSPGTVSSGWEYYRNLTSDDFSVFDFKRNFAGYRFMSNPGSQDLYFVGVKYPATVNLEERLNSVVEEVDQLSKISAQIFATSDRLFLAGDPSGAADCLGSATPSLDKDFEAYSRYKQAWFLMSAKRHSEAGVIIKRLFSLGDKPEYHFQHSHFLHETGQVDAAIEAAHAAIKRKSSNAEYWEHLANLLLNSEDIKGAEDALLEASRLSSLNISLQNRINDMNSRRQHAGKGASDSTLSAYEISFSSLMTADFDQKIRIWNLESPVAGKCEMADEGALNIAGWALPQDAQDAVSVLIRMGAAVEVYEMNVERPDVVTAILQQPPEGHPQLRCGFNFTVPVKAVFFSLGFRVGGVDLWEREVRQVYQPHVMAGKDSWEFPADVINGVLVHHGKPPVFEGVGILAWQKRMAGNSGAMRKPYIVLVAPHKAAVYPNFLPADTALFFERPVYRILAQNPSVVYPLERLVSSNMRRPTYSRLGAVWAPYGAYMAYRAIMDKLSYVRGSLQVVDENRVVWGAEGAVPAFERKAKVVYENGLGGAGKIRYFKNAESALPRAMLFCDAFGMDYFDSFLAESCSELVCVCSADLDMDAITRFAPDFVVSQYSEENLARPPKEPLPICRIIKSGIDSGAYSAAMLEQFISLSKDFSGILGAEEFADLKLGAQAALM